MDYIQGRKADLLAELLFPRGLLDVVGNTSLANISGYVATPPSSALPYNLGYGLVKGGRATVAQGWPLEGAYMTLCQADGVYLQYNFPYIPLSGSGVGATNSKKAFRVNNANAWQDWVYEGNDRYSWTPTLAGTTTAGANTYAYQSGWYTAHDGICTLGFALGLTAKDPAMAGNLEILGLPISFNSPAPISARSGMVGNLAAANDVNFSMTGGPTISLRKFTTTGSSPSALVPADITATFFIEGEISYPF